MKYKPPQGISVLPQTVTPSSSLCYLLTVYESRGYLSVGYKSLEPWHFRPIHMELENGTSSTYDTLARRSSWLHEVKKLEIENSKKMKALEV